MAEVRINIPIPKKQHDELLSLKETTGASLVWLLQQAITQYLESRKKDLQK
jgi:hypothetical protein